MGGLTVRRSTLRFPVSWNLSGGATKPARQCRSECKPILPRGSSRAAGGERTAIVECWRLAEANGWRMEAGRAEAFIATPLREVPPPRGTALHVGWHGEKIGAFCLMTDRAGTGSRPVSEGATPVRIGAPGRLPPFIESLLPEGWLERVLKPKSEQERISAGKRYMSNYCRLREPRRSSVTSARGRAGGAARQRTRKRALSPAATPGPRPSFDETLEDRIAALFASGGDTAPFGRSNQGADESLA